MFGDAYFEARKNLIQLSFRVLELAEKTGADQTPLTTGDAAQGLESPFLFLACGEQDAGKSTFLNAIFGSNLCGDQYSLSGYKSKKARVQWFRYGKENRDREVTPQIEECYRTDEFLKRFNLMDTPGCNLKGGEFIPIIKRFLPSADLIFWVISVENPWAASVWKFLSEQSEVILKKSVIILQQTDLKNEAELDIIYGHVKDLAQQRLKNPPLILPVSAEGALKAKLVEPMNEEEWHRSGYSTLESYIADQVAHSPARQRMLKAVREGLAKVLRSIENKIEDRSMLLEGNEQFLRELEDEVESERERNFGDFWLKFAAIRDVFIGKNKEVKRYVRRKLGFVCSLKSLLTAENTSKAIESWLVDSIASAVVEQVDRDSAQLVEDCRRHWETVRPRVRSRLDISLNEFDQVGKDFDKLRESFHSRMDAVTRQAVMNLRIRKSMSSGIVERQEPLKNWLYVTFICIMVAGVLGSLGEGVSHVGGWYLPAWFLLASGVCLVGFAIHVRIYARKLTKYFGRLLEDSRFLFVRDLEEDYRDGVREFYVTYRSLLRSVRQHIFEMDKELQPQREEKNALFLELMILEHEF